MNVDDAGCRVVGERFDKGFLEGFFIGCVVPIQRAEELAEPVEIPAADVVERPVEDVPFGAVPAIVENHHDRREAEAYVGREFGAGHLERAVSDQN